VYCGEGPGVRCILERGRGVRCTAERGAGGEVKNSTFFLIYKKFVILLPRNNNKNISKHVQK
jgi:hypothetical protein